MKNLRILFMLAAFGLLSYPCLSGGVRVEYIPNGLKLIHRQTTANKILGVVCMVRTGSYYETDDISGISSLLQTLLLKGTASRSAADIALALENEGINMDTDASEDYVMISAVAMNDQLDTVMQLMSEVLFEPSFPFEEVEKEKKNAIAAIHLREDDKFNLAMKKMRALIYEGNPYARHPEGTPETIAQLSRERIADFHDQFYQPQNMILSIVGDVDHSNVQAVAQKYFGSREPRVVQVATSYQKPAMQRRAETIFKPVEQGVIVIGHVGVPMDHKDFPALRVTSAVLGEGMSSRFFSELRDRQGLAYAVGSFCMTQNRAGVLAGYIGTRPESIDDARTGMLDLFDKLENDPLPEEELERARNYIIGKFLIGHETNLKKAFYLAWFEQMGLGAAFDEKYPELIKSVKVKDVRRIARKYFRAPVTVTLRPPQEQSPTE
ncbi:MAG TPA: pitrilysin family protein [Candidatus Sumerlaeota bacterium]|nr:pitrilysin family protein [Candidatus Sumerlaeota bacterium]